MRNTKKTLKIFKIIIIGIVIFLVVSVLIDEIL